MAEIVSRIVDIAATAMETFIVIQLIDLLAEEKKEKLHKTFMVALYLVAVSSVAIFNQINLYSIYTTFVFLTIHVIFSQLLYKINLFKASAAGMIFFCVSGATGFIISGAIEQIVNVPHFFGDSIYQFSIYRIFLVVVTKIIDFTFFKLVKKYNVFGNEKTRIKNLLIINSVSIGVFLLMNELQKKFNSTDYMDVRYSETMAWLFILVAIVIAYIALYHQKDAHKQKEENSIMATYNKVRDEADEKREVQDKENKQRLHDVDNHFSAISAFAENNDIKGLENYLSPILKKPFAHQDKKYTGSKVIDWQLNAAAQQARNHDIDMTIWATFPVGCNIEQHHLNRIFGNLLDNALEACRKLSPNMVKFIKVNIQFDIDTIYINISNSALDPNIVDGELKTSKDDKNLHGLGLKSVNSVAKMYNGNLNHNYNNNVFTVVVTLEYK